MNIAYFAVFFAILGIIISCIALGYSVTFTKNTSYLLLNGNSKMAGKLNVATFPLVSNNKILIGVGSSENSLLLGTQSAVNDTPNSIIIGDKSLVNIRPLSTDVNLGSSENTFHSLYMTGDIASQESPMESIYLDGNINDIPIDNFVSSSGNSTQNHLVSFANGNSVVDSGFGRYIMGTDWLYGSVEVFGDRVSTGYGLPEPTEDRWSSRLASIYNFDEVNFASNNDCMQDMLLRTYVSHNMEHNSMVKIGFNDVAHPDWSASSLILYKELFFEQMLFLLLPSSSFINAQSIQISPWVNFTQYPVGIYTTSTGSFTELKVNSPLGRYVGFVVSANYVESVAFECSIDGNQVITYEQPRLPFIGDGGSENGGIVFLFDTGLSGVDQTHTLSVTSVYESASPLAINYFFGFNSLSNGNNVFVSGIEALSTYPYRDTTLTKLLQMTSIQQSCVSWLRQKFSAKITYSSRMEDFGNICKQSINDAPIANKEGQNRIVESAVQTLVSGEMISWV